MQVSVVDCEAMHRMAVGYQQRFGAAMSSTDMDAFMALARRFHVDPVAHTYREVQSTFDAVTTQLARALRQERERRDFERWRKEQ